MIFSTLQCSLSQYYEVRSQFLKPVNYTGGLCRVSDDIQGKLLTRKPASGDQVFAKKISRILARQAAYFAVTVSDEESGYTLQLNPDQMFHAASTYKAAILLAVMRLDQDGGLSIHDKIPVINRFESVVDGSYFSVENDVSEPDDTFEQIEKEVPITYLLDTMIEKSSNLAANVLVQQIGIVKINDTLKNLGSQIIVARGVSDDKAYADCINNLVTARDLETLYKIIYETGKFDDRHRTIILDTLKKSSESGRLPGKLPENVQVAHKPGNTSKVFHDAGIVMPESGSPYFVAILTSQYKSEKKMNKVIAEVSYLIYREVLKARSEKIKSKGT